MKWILTAILILASQPAAAWVYTTIDLSRQRMYVSVKGKHVASWKISSGRRGYETPRGKWKPQRLHRRWYSRQYDNAPMPYSVFYHRGYAIHGTNEVRRLGRPASHGCIRLRPRHARVFFKLVRKYGMRKTTIVVAGRAKQRRR